MQNILSTTNLPAQKIRRFWYGNKAYRILSNSVDCKAYEFNPDVRSSIRSQFGFCDSLVIAHIGKTDVTQKIIRLYFAFLSM